MTNTMQFSECFITLVLDQIYENIKCLRYLRELKLSRKINTLRKMVNSSMKVYRRKRLFYAEKNEKAYSA